MTDPLPSAACPDCGTPLPPESPQALCPACLMRQALASRTIVHDGGKLPHLPPPSPEEIADKFPGYEILECLGRGGMGVVYKARQKSLNRLVAIKILAPERVGEEKFAGRFTIEAELLAKLSHPHIVTIHDFGATDSQPSTPDSQPLYYLVMEFIDGVNLRDLLREGKLEPKQALAIVPPVCDALQYAHDKGIVHRDIKPENLLLDRDGRIKIADFGIAKLIGTVASVCDRRTSEEENQRRSQSDATVNAGTLGYSAPEQTSDPQHVDQRADIYSLGVVLYEMLTGERPNKELVAPSKKVQIDVRLDEIVLRALEKTPALRYQTAGEFRTVLETMAGTPSGAAERHAGKEGTKNSSAALRSSLFAVICSLGFLPLIALGSAEAIMIGSALMLVVGLLWFAPGIRRQALLVALAGAGIAAAVVMFVNRNPQTTEARPVPVDPSEMAITRVVADGNKVVIEGRAPSNGRISFYADRPGNGWSCGFPEACRFTATLEKGWRGLQCRVQPENGDPVLTMDGTNQIGDEKLTDGKLLFRAGRPVREEKGVWTATIGEWITKAGHKVPICVSLMLVESPETGKEAARLSQEGWRLWQTGQAAEARPKFEEAVKLAPRDANAWNGLGWALFNSGNPTEAEKAFQKAIELDPIIPGGLNGMGQIRLSQRRYDQAETYLLKAAEQRATAGMYGLARLYLLQGNFEQAEKWAQMLVDSGAADEGAGKMLEAAKAKKLSAGLRMMIEPAAPPAAEKTPPDNRTDKIAVEDLALQMIVAIREKDDAKLKSLATDRIKGWPDALPVFAVEMREHYRQMVGDEKFDLRAGESLVEGDLAAVRCTGPEKLKDVCLITFFVKTDDGWRNHSLRNSMDDVPLASQLADFKKANAALLKAEGR